MWIEKNLVTLQEKVAAALREFDAFGKRVPTMKPATHLSLVPPSEEPPQNGA